jgi:hypothetical protein
MQDMTRGLSSLNLRKKRGIPVLKGKSLEFHNLRHLFLTHLPMPGNYVLNWLCGLILFPAVLFAQTPKVERSQSFVEPESGASRLIMLKNGNTLFLNFTRKDGIKVTVYDPAHNARPVVEISGKVWEPRKMDDTKLKGFYEIGGNVVVFLEQIVQRAPSLYRLVIDGKTGTLLKEEKIAQLPTVDVGSAWGMTFGGLSIPDFYVRKDPQSDYYAVVSFNSLSHDRDKRIEVVHYGPDHSEINRAYYESPEGTYKYLKFLDMYVKGGEFVFMVNYAYNTRMSGGKDSRVLISQLKSGDKAFKYQFLNYTDDFKNIEAVTRYDSITKKLFLLTSIAAKSTDQEPSMELSGVGPDGRMVLLMNVIDPATIKVTKKYFINHPRLSDFTEKHLKYKNPYVGVIQDFRINPDHSITLMYEEMKQTHPSISSTSSASGRTTTHTSTYTQLGDIGIIRINSAGKELSGYALPKTQRTETAMNEFELNRRPTVNWTYRRMGLSVNNFNDISGFFSYDYLNVNNREIIIYNDYARNVDDEDENYRKKKTMRFISDAHTVYAVYENGTLKKNYLFGDPENENNNCFCSLEMNTYGQDGKSFATMMIEKKDKEKKAYLVWVTF